ncbi:GntR family transcriptional regulator [Arthrobacter sp. GMC3]|uniref:GntR family transcriptional regulator n=1 Tax=Arthrobacter sp. GMC3 TaxID=2058894 RepID=UPI000CE56F3B|nr:GntR family transcriptional regulator [Arthrobacter sp. GMC3]
MAGPGVTLLQALARHKESGPNARPAQTGIWVAQVLRNCINDGELVPGAKLSEESLGEALGVSRNTLREAFAALSAERILTRIPNRGVFVAAPTADDVREIYRVRRVLEPAALTTAPAPSAQALAALSQVAKEGLAARAAADSSGMADANQKFHKLVVALANSTRLDALMAQILAEMRLVFHAMAKDPAFHGRFVLENATIVGLLVKGSGGQAGQAMTSYLDRAEAELLAAIPA